MATKRQLENQLAALTLKLDAILASNADSSPTPPATDAVVKPRKKSKKQLEHARVKAVNAKAGRGMTTARYTCLGDGDKPCSGYWYHEAKAQAHTGKTGHKTATV